MAHGPRKKPLEFGGNPDHVTLGLGLGGAQWLKWSCEAGGGGSPDEARLEQPHTHSTPN